MIEQKKKPLELPDHKPRGLREIVTEYMLAAPHFDSHIHLPVTFANQTPPMWPCHRRRSQP